MVDKPSRIPLWSRKSARRIGVLLTVLTLFFVYGYLAMIRMPGDSHRGPLAPLTAEEAALRDELRRDVSTLAAEIGNRNVESYDALVKSADFLERSLTQAGYAVRRMGYPVLGRTCDNLEVEIPGTDRAAEIVVIGGHYDSVVQCPGANDNATGAAAVLALARRFAGKKPARTLRFVEFVNEEPGHFQTEDMGSLVYARACRQRNDQVVAMLSLETMGYYSDAPHSQTYPFPFSLFYPSVGNFVAFVGNYGSRDLVRESIRSFRRHARFPSEGAAVPDFFPGIGWSDHWSFWQVGYPGAMVTDTAPFRYPHYHSFEDTVDKIDFDRFARVVAALEKVVDDLVNPRVPPK